MQKIVKVLLTFFIMGLVFVFPVVTEESWAKENLQNMYMEFLRAQGYLPLVDEDGDILFKVSGDNYYIIIDENDLQFFRIYMGLNVSSFPAEDAQNAANFANRHSKVAKIYISSDGKIAAINAELLLNNPENFSPVFSRALAVIRNAENNFMSQLR